MDWISYLRPYLGGDGGNFTHSQILVELFKKLTYPEVARLSSTMVLFIIVVQISLNNRGKIVLPDRYSIKVSWLVWDCIVLNCFAGWVRQECIVVASESLFLQCHSYLLSKEPSRLVVSHSSPRRLWCYPISICGTRLKFKQLWGDKPSTDVTSAAESTRWYDN